MSQSVNSNKYPTLLTLIDSLDKDSNTDSERRANLFSEYVGEDIDEDILDFLVHIINYKYKTPIYGGCHSVLEMLERVYTGSSEDLIKLPVLLNNISVAYNKISDITNDSCVMVQVIFSVLIVELIPIERIINTPIFTSIIDGEESFMKTELLDGVQYREVLVALYIHILTSHYGVKEDFARVIDTSNTVEDIIGVLLDIYSHGPLLKSYNYNQLIDENKFKGVVILSEDRIAYQSIIARLNDSNNNNLGLFRRYKVMKHDFNTGITENVLRESVINRGVLVSGLSKFTDISGIDDYLVIRVCTIPCSEELPEPSTKNNHVYIPVWNGEFHTNVIDKIVRDLSDYLSE